MQVSRGRVGMGSVVWDDTFEGSVWADPIVWDPPRLRVATVHFAPCSRTYWHHHDGGQVLHITGGRGFVCAEGEDPVEVREGDTVWTAPGERHWHGAGVDSFLVHRAYSIGETHWLDRVADGLYPEKGDQR
jgi:quercetin dioxygenase-like cupin family protein